MEKVNRQDAKSAKVRQEKELDRINKIYWTD
jgi:hypothetical protein